MAAVVPGAVGAGGDDARRPAAHPGTLAWRDAFIIAIPLCLFYAFVCLTPWYICRQLPLRSGDKLKLALNHIGAALLASAIWVELARLIAYLLGASAQLRPEIPHLVIVGLLLYSLSVALHYMLLAVEQSRESELQARDAELRALKAQINPHFLFNSLNSITALTTVDPARAREMCIRLSDFLRNTLGLGERESISWREELQLARIYLDVGAGALRRPSARRDERGRRLLAIAWCRRWCFSR